MAENSEKVSNDILKWFSIVTCQEIFNHLDGKDIIQASIVNKEWYKFTAENQQAAKLKLVFNGNKYESMTEEVMDVLKNSKRNYQKIMFDHVQFNGSGFFSTILASKASSWKSVAFEFCGSYDEETLIKILQTIEPTVEELTIDWKCIIAQSHQERLQEIKTWTFSKLKILSCKKNVFRIAEYSPEIFQYFHGCKNLTKLSWKMLDDEAMNSLATILSNNRHLKSLSLREKDWKLLEQASRLRFRLQQLELHRGSSANAPELLYSFLEAQAQTLQVLDFQVQLNEAFLWLILNMPRLKSLRIDFLQVGDVISNCEHVLPVNRSIESLDLYAINGEAQHSYESFIKSMPNLKHLKCLYMNDEQFNFLTRQVPDLESIEANYFMVFTFPESNVFPNFKKFRAKNFPMKDLFEAPTGNDNFALLVRLEAEKNFDAISKAASFFLNYEATRIKCTS